MATGLILLAFLGALIAFFTIRIRRRMGVGSTGKTWLTIITGVIIAGLLLWAAGTH
jgi:hypothetical protein